MFFVVWSPHGASLIEIEALYNKHFCTILEGIVQVYTAYMLDYIFGDLNEASAQCAAMLVSPKMKSMISQKTVSVVGHIIYGFICHVLVNSGQMQLKTCIEPHVGLKSYNCI